MELETTTVFTKDIPLVLIYEVLRQICNQDENIIYLIGEYANDILGDKYKWFYLHPYTGKFILYQDLNIQEKLEEQFIKENRMQFTAPKDVIENTIIMKREFTIYTSKNYDYKHISNYDNDNDIKIIHRFCGCPKCMHTNKEVYVIKKSYYRKYEICSSHDEHKGKISTNIYNITAINCNLHHIYI